MDAEAQDKVALSGDGTIRRDGRPLKELGGGGRGSLHSAGPGGIKCPAKSCVGRARPCGQHLSDAAHIWSKE